MNINNFSPRPGRLIREDGSVVNLADCITDDGKLRVEGLGGGGGPVQWDDIENKPATYPPEAHTHPIAQVTGLQAALDAKLTASKAVAQADSEAADIEGLVADFNALLAKLRAAGIMN